MLMELPRKDCWERGSGVAHLRFCLQLTEGSKAAVRKIKTHTGKNACATVLLKLVRISQGTCRTHSCVPHRDSSRCLAWIFFDIHSNNKCVEMSLDTARTSACATLVAAFLYLDQTTGERGATADIGQSVGRQNVDIAGIGGEFVPAHGGRAYRTWTNDAVNLRHQKATAPAVEHPHAISGGNGTLPGILRVEVEQRGLAVRPG